MHLFVILLLSLSLVACQPVGTHKKSPMVSREVLEKNAHNAYSNGDFRKSAGYYSDLIQSDADYVPYLLGFANAKRRSGDTDTALTYYGRVLDVDAENVTALEGRGLALLSGGNYAQAIEQFSVVLGIDALNWKTLNGLGVAHSLTNQHVLALDYYTDALEISNNSPIVMNNIALAYAFQEDYFRASDYLRKASSRFVSDKSKLKKSELNLALIYGLEGRMKESEILLRKYFSEPVVYHNLGVIRHLADDNDLAQTYIHKALSSSPEFYEGAWDTLQRVEPMVSKE